MAGGLVLRGLVREKLDIVLDPNHYCPSGARGSP